MVSSKFSGVVKTGCTCTNSPLSTCIDKCMDKSSNIVGGSVLFASLFPHRLTPRET